MASIQTESVEQVDNVRLRILVDKEKNKVVYAEAGKDFVDALFSFLTLPLGTIARFVAKDSNIEAVKFGSISSLYQSVSNLDQQYLSSLTCKEMLLQPRNSMEDYCRQLKLNIDDTERLQYFVCENWDCRRKENATFIISDDLCVMPNVFGASLNLLQKLGVETIDAIEEQAVDINKKEVVDLLKLSLISKTPLTDFFLRKSQSVDNLNLRNNIEFLIGDLPSDEDRQMSVKVTLRKTNEQILFVEAGDDFIDFVFSFLTFPLGGVLHMLQGFSSLSSIDNLYKSFSDLSPDIYLMSEGLKDKLCKPLIAPQFELKNPILPIGAAFLPVNYCHTYYDYTRMRYTDLTKEMVYSNYNRIHEEKHVPFKVVDPKSSNAKSSYAKGPSMYMVTDDLCVSPMSSISTMSLLKRSKVPLSDLEERVIKIGVKEGLSILKASLTSASALTNGLNQLIRTVKDIQVSTSAFSAPEDGAGPESNFEALGINNASSLSVQLPDCSSGTQVLQVPTATLVEELPLPPKIQEKENKTPALALRRSTRKRKASDNA
ncbi:uncharacterized protein [Medicago truncatula]|uniref:uncharacterized protein n=1 Tax=Medicago truncatula TaxID=3880 RepID=UPI000D2F332B|nr:uncharacterized protein LOC25498693 [Medicago truncatula]